MFTCVQNPGAIFDSSVLLEGAHRPQYGVRQRQWQGCLGTDQEVNSQVPEVFDNTLGAVETSVKASHRRIVRAWLVQPLTLLMKKLKPRLMRSIDKGHLASSFKRDRALPSQCPSHNDTNQQGARVMDFWLEYRAQTTKLFHTSDILV